MPRKTFRRRAPRSRKRTYRKRRTGRKRTYRRGKRSNIVSAKFSSLATGFPEILYTRLKYFENSYSFSLATTTLISLTSLAINNPFDPYTATGGKSALYYSTYANIYKYCRVMAAKVTLTVNKITDANTSTIFAFLPREFGGGPFTDIDNVISQPRVKWMRGTPGRVGNSRVLTYYIPVSTCLQMSRMQYMAELPNGPYDCLCPQGPTFNALLDLYFAKTTEDITTTVTFEGSIKIVFYCKFSTRWRYQEAGFDVDQSMANQGELAKVTTLNPLIIADI